MLKEELDEFISKIENKNIIPGMGISIIENEQAPLISTYGFAEIKNKIPMSDDHLFQVASLSKPVTAWGIMLLVQERKIKLDDPVNNYLTKWKIPSNSYDSNKVTVRQLLSHTSGICPVEYQGIQLAGEVYTLEESLKGKYSFTTKVELLHPPGNRFLYTGAGYTILQLLIEEVTGDRFEVYMESKVLIPLGLRKSTYKWESVLDKEISRSYNLFGEELPQKIFPEKAAAGLLSTLPDITKFVQANINYTGLLNKSSLSMLHSRVHRAIPYGLGFQITTLANGNRIIFHNGHINGWSSSFIFTTNCNSALIILTNSESGHYVIRDLITLWVQRKFSNVTENSLKSILPQN
ncbi:serine hydrolase domain-containing protein [Paenibacillus sp. FSL H3-0457]|uniref:serine hydrolase domain-containing protein n=1 Tax=Paenibacillus sp. FSL H3-0457 TaxID=2921430 RepID=UPI0030EEE59E